MTEFSPIDDHSTPRNTRTAIVSGISKASAVLVLLLALGAFFLSYESLRDLAANSGAVAPGQAWMFPLVIDGSIMVFSLAALRASLTGESTSWYLTLVVGVTVASAGLNAAHARGGILPRCMAGMAPLLLFAAFESFMRMLASNLGGRESGKPKPAASSAHQVSGQTSDRRSLVRKLLAEGVSRNAMARQLGVSAATIRRDLAQMVAE